MGIPSYKVREHRGKQAKSSLTQPCKGTLEVVIKKEGNEARGCVYNEMVALALGNAIGIPLVQGVPAVTDDGLCFASLMVGGMSISLPDVRERRHAAAAKRYPRECAALFAFDVWIGNNDRVSNFKANLTAAPMQIFAGFDQEGGLLKYIDSIQDRLDKLRDTDRRVMHPFSKRLKREQIHEWENRIMALPDERIGECVMLKRSIHGIHEEEQQALAKILEQRRDALPTLLDASLQS